MRRVTKVKYDGRRVRVEYEIPREDEPDEFVLVCNARPAREFLEALAALRDHVAEICELEVEYMATAEVRGVSYSYAGPDQAMGATITALKTLETARSPLVLNTPHLASAPMSETDEAPLLSPGAIEALEDLATEALRYVDGHREQADLFAPVAQAVASLAPTPGSGIEAVTLSAGGRSVTLTAEDGERLGRLQKDGSSWAARARRQP